MTQTFQIVRTAVCWYFLFLFVCPQNRDSFSKDNADIPDNREDAFRDNAMRQTRSAAVEQVKDMVSLVDDIALTVITNSVEGEEMRISTPLGMQMIMGK